MTKIYHKTFGVSELDRERDEALSLRMAALGFIQPTHLDIPDLYTDEKAWQLAIKELHKINNYKARTEPGRWLCLSFKSCTAVSDAKALAFWGARTQYAFLIAYRNVSGGAGAPGQAGVRPKLLPRDQQPAARRGRSRRGARCVCSPCTRLPGQLRCSLYLWTWEMAGHRCLHIQLHARALSRCQR